MPIKFNPLAGQFDLVGSGGGGSSYIDGEVQNFSALPETLGSPAVDSAYLVREAEGTWLLGRKPAGIYVRTANTGVRASDWTHAGAFPDVFSDANFVLYDNGDSTRNLQFQLSGIDTATTRTLTAPNASGTIARTEDFAAPPAIGSTTRNTGAFTTLNATNGTITASAPVLDLSQTWNNAAVTFTGLRFNVTNTASAAASKAIDFQIGGTSVLETSPVGLTTIRRLGASTFANALEVRRDSTLIFNVRDDGAIAAANGVSASAAATVAIHPSNGVMLNSLLPIGWATGSTSAFGGSDLFLFRDGAAGTLAQRNGTNPQTFRIYNTFTDASNYERGFMRWSSNVLQIGTEKAGTGSARALELQSDGVTRLTVQTGGTVALSSHLTAENGFIRIASAQSFQWLNRSKVYSLADGNIGLYNTGESSFNLLQFGGTTSSFPALKRSSTTLQVRLANDSDFTAIQGKLTTETAYTAGAPTATGYLVLYDSNGTAYKVPAEAL